MSNQSVRTWDSAAGKPDPIREIGAAMQARVADIVGQPRLVEFGLVARAIHTHQFAIPFLLLQVQEKSIQILISPLSMRDRIPDIVLAPSLEMK